MPFCETCLEAAPFHELTAPTVNTFVAHGKEVPSVGRCLKCIAASEKKFREALSMRWLIWSNEHRAWWRPNSAGYTLFAEAAGRYSYEEAVQICTLARSHGPDGEPPPETMIREDSIITREGGKP